MASIIVMADEVGVLRSLAAIVAANGHVVTAVGDGVTGLRMLTETMFDVVITDIRRPGLSGLEVISRGRERSPGTRFLAIVGADVKSRALPPLPSAQKFGADGLLLRPCNDDAMLALLEELLNERRAFV